MATSSFAFPIPTNLASELKEKATNYAKEHFTSYWDVLQRQVGNSIKAKLGVGKIDSSSATATTKPAAEFKVSGWNIWG